MNSAEPRAAAPGVGGSSNARTGSATRTRAAVLLGLTCFLVYNVNLRWIGSYDSMASSLLPFNLWQGKGFYLDEYADYGPDMGYSIVRTRNGRWGSLYPIVTPLLVSPLYFATRLTDALRFERTTQKEYQRWLMEKLSASILASLSVVFLWGALRGITSRRKAALLAAAYAFGTVTWTISSQALWQHGAAQLFVSASLYLLYGREVRSGTAAALGLLAGLIAANRPADLFFSAAFGLILLRRQGRRSWPFFAAAAVPVVLVLLYNLTFFGSPTGGYVMFRFPDGDGVRFGANPLVGTFHLVFSNRGLLFFSPFFLFLLRKRTGDAGCGAPDRVERALLFGAVAATWLLHTSLNTGWSGGYTYGPRYAADALPILVFLLASHLDGALRRTEKFLLGATLTIAFAIQLVGAFCYPGGNSGTEDYGYWDFSRSGPVLAFRAGVQQPHFLGFVARRLTVDRPLEPHERRAAYRWDLDAEEEWPAGTSRKARFRIWNESSVSWSSLGSWGESNGIRIVFRWKSLDPRVPSWTQEIQQGVGFRFLPGHRIRRSVTLRAPEAPGWYRLTLELVQIGVGRFSEGGSPPLEADIHVTGPPAASGQFSSSPDPLRVGAASASSLRSARPARGEFWTSSTTAWSRS